MKNNWPETVDELIEECRRLISEYDLYTLGERGEPFSGETEPRVDGTEYLAGEHQYGISMIPAQWVTHVLKVATLGGGKCETCHAESDLSEWVCSECQCWIPLGITPENIGRASELRFCPHCGRKVVM